RRAARRVRGRAGLLHRLHAGVADGRVDRGLLGARPRAGSAFAAGSKGFVAVDRAQRVELTAAAGIIAYALGCALGDYGKIPHLTYQPAEHRFFLAARTSGAVMGYAGQWLWALLFAALVAGATWFVLGRRRANVAPRGVALASAWAGTAFALAL